MKIGCMPFLLLATALAVTACSHTPRLPEEVLIPVPVPCEIAQVEERELPEMRPDMNVFEAAQTAVAAHKLLLAEVIELRAANRTPCPTEIEQ